jgi:hypothetical protein
MSEIDGAVKTKVLAELMHHMMSMHGSAKPAISHGPSNAELPHADGTPKHEPAGALQGMTIPTGKPLKGASHHMKEGSPGEEAMETPEEESHEPKPGDLFGRKGGKKVAF